MLYSGEKVKKSVTQRMRGVFICFIVGYKKKVEGYLNWVKGFEDLVKLYNPVEPLSN
jgi:hypothetical protein